jgi:hypothetical protein
MPLEIQWRDIPLRHCLTFGAGPSTEFNRGLKPNGGRLRATLLACLDKGNGSVSGTNLE